jgi:tRNA G18 (ribose-2'-O)-methylase SpoU
MTHVQLDHIDHQTSNQKFPLCLLVLDVERPDNVGSIFRLADALGIEQVYLSGKSITPPNSKIRKTSRSTERFVCFSYQENPIEIIHQLKAQDYKIISLEITSNSVPLDKLALLSEEKVCLVLGSESQGVRDSVLTLSDKIVHIPMLGKNSSMNVANACAIASYTITQQLKSVSVD